MRGFICEESVANGAGRSGIWKKAKADGEGFKRNLSIRRLNYNANLGRFGGQDDPSLQAVLEWEPRN
ncbi:hypothetical protein [Brucella anthropi]|uniref:hypothetical protein n=1 Tax=Brucella anthropi TaxID=529 RepID=UPI003D9757D0